MKKVLKRLSVVALSALMVGGAVASFSGCGETDDTITVFIFAGTDDQETNTDMIEDWAKEYSQKLIDQGLKEDGYVIPTKCTYMTDTNDYFTALKQSVVSGSAQDVFYVSPKYVKAWAKKGTVLDLSKYFDAKEMGVDPSGIYSQALGLYSYDGTNLGDPVHYDSASGTFINESTEKETAIYAFPKDYSTFGLGYNAVYFSDEYKTAYTSTKALDADTYNGKSIITVAATGDAANVINVGVPTTYYPYNFYEFDSYEQALAGGDPVAQLSKLNDGYTVTIPGFPGETYDRGSDDASTSYDDSIGYITYTYAEYGAVTWALTYYWNMIQGRKAGTRVYGNDQYESTLYLLPWLAGNNADYINSAKGTSTSDGSEHSAYTSVQSGTYTNSDKETISYGIDNEEFIETYAAFAAYGSDWNGNSYYCGDGKQVDGYANFKAGNILFYGVGTWDAAGFNGCAEDVLVYRLMPEPVSEDYALYSRVKDAEYNSVVYTGKTKTDSKTDSGVKASYSAAEIQANQETRQEAWAGRVDSVGFGVNSQVLNSGESWKAEACVDLIVNMSITMTGQARLTYSGSQLPNYSSMVEDYVGIGSKDHTPTGTFEDAITPDDPQWDKYYEAQATLVSERSNTTTVEEFMADKYPTLAYNKAYKDYTMKKIKSNIRAYLVLNMLALDYNSRNLCLRMVDGVNGVTDSATYTYDDEWLDVFAAAKTTSLLAYTNQAKGTISYTNNPDSVNGTTICTPYAYCMHYVSAVQTQLNVAIKDETEAIGS